MVSLAFVIIRIGQTCQGENEREREPTETSLRCQVPLQARGDAEVVEEEGEELIETFQLHSKGQVKVRK